MAALAVDGVTRTPFLVPGNLQLSVVFLGRIQGPRSEPNSFLGVHQPVPSGVRAEHPPPRPAAVLLVALFPDGWPRPANGQPRPARFHMLRGHQVQDCLLLPAFPGGHLCPGREGPSAFWAESLQMGVLRPAPSPSCDPPSTLGMSPEVLGFMKSQFLCATSTFITHPKSLPHPNQSLAF